MSRLPGREADIAANDSKERNKECVARRDGDSAGRNCFFDKKGGEPISTDWPIRSSAEVYVCVSAPSTDSEGRRNRVERRLG